MTDGVREYQYVVDRDGRIFHDGTEIVDPAVLRFFLRAMTRTARTFDRSAITSSVSPSAK